MSAEQTSEKRLKLLHGLTAMACGQVAVLGEWTFQSIARAAYDEIERLQGQWLGMKSEVQVCHTVIGRLEAERDRLRALLTELVDLEGPQPGNIAWARKVWTELGLPDPSAQEDSGND